jgi:hypothetical protein
MSDTVAAIRGGVRARVSEGARTRRSALWMLTIVLERPDAQDRVKAALDRAGRGGSA